MNTPALSYNELNRIHPQQPSHKHARTHTHTHS